MTDAWERGLPPLPLRQGDVHVWQARLDQPPAIVTAMKTLLADDETARAQRFHRERDDHAYSVAHGFLRVVLGAYCQTPPAALHFGVARYGKPYLIQPRAVSKLRFNLSHSRDLALVAVTVGREVGVDIEAMRPLEDADVIAQHFFSPTERATLLSLPATHKEQAFYTCWSRKEAFIKVLGLGLTMPLDTFAVTLAPDSPAQIIHIAGHDRTPPRWSMHDLPPISGYATALVLLGTCDHVLCKIWTPDTLLTE